MNPITCGMAADLLPLYLDGCCSADSRAALEAHMDACPACRAQYAQLRRDLTPAAPAAEDPGTDGIARALARKMRRRKRCLRALCAVLGVLLAVLLVFIGKTIVILGQPGGAVSAEVEDGADDQDHRHADEVFAGIAHVLLEQAVHDGVGDGVGGTALRVDLRLQAAEEDHEEEALDGGEHTADIVADEAVDKRQRVAGDDDARAGKCGQIDRPVFIAEIDNDQKTKDTADDAQC